MQISIHELREAVRWDTGLTVKEPEIHQLGEDYHFYRVKVLGDESQLSMVEGFIRSLGFDIRRVNVTLREIYIPVEVEA